MLERYAASGGGCRLGNASRVAGTKDSMATPATRAAAPSGTPTPSAVREYHNSVSKGKSASRHRSH